MREDQNQPEVSVILTAYNEEMLIRRSVNSILGQTFEDFELLLIDDGSTDRTWEIIQDFKDPRIRRKQLDRVGRSRALNWGLNLARGKYVALMDADDESLSERLENQVAFLDSNPTISILGTTYYRYDARRNERYVRSFPSNDREIRHSMALYIPICNGSVMYRKAVVEKVGGYNENIDDLEDLDLWLRAASHFQFANLGPPPLHIYWFDPKHSYFETSHGSYRRVWRGLKLNGRAIRQFQLPAYYYALLGAKLLYYAILPNRLKRIARNLVSGGIELPVGSQYPGRERPVHGEMAKLG